MDLFIPKVFLLFSFGCSNGFLVCIWVTSCYSSMQDLCAICTDFIISELWTSNFLVYQV